MQRVDSVSARRLSPQVRAGLDLARSAAAVYVVLHHTVTAPEPLAALFTFGQEAVLVFFLLSGFVIFANERDRVRHPRGYYLRRLRRIYPPMIVAMLISTALWAAGLIDVRLTWESAIGTLFALQDIPLLKPGVITGPYLGNDPLWSLSYEIAFYLLFPLVMVLWRRSERLTRILIPVVSIVAYGTYAWFPNHFSLMVAYFMMWWAGAMAAHLWTSGRLNVRNAGCEIAGLVGLAGVAGVAVALYGFHGIGYFPFLIFRHCFFVTVLFLLLLVGPVRRLLARMSEPVALPAAVIASVSYGLYVVHYPIMVQTHANYSWWVVPALAATIAAAWVADRGVPHLLPKAPKD